MNPNLVNKIIKAVQRAKEYQKRFLNCMGVVRKNRTTEEQKELV